MTHLHPGGATTAVPPTMISRPPVLDPGHHLDLRGLREGIASRHRRLSDLEVELVAACEREAAGSRASTVRMDDRKTWDRHTWNRYLAVAAELEPEYGPEMRRLLREIAQLTRLTDLPVAMETAA
ncbi:MAG: hypothetical protein WBQ75_12600 [Acetobacteraceae bacterium]